jgi:nitric oxide reductase NorD protein
MTAPPRIELDWEESIFRGLLSLWRRWAPKSQGLGPGAVALQPEHRALTTLAQMLAAEPVRVLAARGIGGIRGRDLLLPPVFDLAPDARTNRRLLVVRTAISAAMRRLSRGVALDLAGPAAPLDSLRFAREASDWLEDELPGFARENQEALVWIETNRPELESLRGRARLLEGARRSAIRGERPWVDANLREAIERTPKRGPDSPGIPLWGELIETISGSDGTAGNPDEHTPRESDVDSEEIAPAIEALRRVELDPKEKEEVVLVHNFEKVEALDSYNGGVRNTDGSDELDAHLDALDEVELGDLIRDDDVAHSVLRADLSLGLDVPDVGSVGPDERGIAYDEWDGRKNRYRREWCTVYPAPMRATEPRFAAEALTRHGRLVRELRRRLEIHRTGLRSKDRQLDGDDVDLAALVDAHGSMRAGRGLDPRLYIRQERQRRDFATTILLDISLSTDSWVDNRRVLDVAREAILVLGEVTDQLGDRLQLLTFASHTRNHCRVWEVKGWDDPWPTARDRLGAIAPQGYTRIGPALRHATAGLATEPADQRLLLLVSDGKPTDYDRYEGRYGIADIRQALREADRAGVHTHALAVDAVARDYLPPMFGPGNWDVLTHPDQLPEVLTTVYGRRTGA